jgi:AcrR family transcriptional regulator
MEQRILDTADRLFYRQGIRVIGVDTVATEIGISKCTLYNYFPSKDDYYEWRPKVFDRSLLILVDWGNDFLVPCVRKCCRDA